MPILRPLLIFGTRPEAIKMAPVVQACLAHDQVEPIVCLTGQHREMLDQVTQYFGLSADLDLQLMQPDQTLAGLTAACIEGVDRAIADYRPDCVVVQGDTTSVMATSLAAFYRRVGLVHVEAGLRTGNILSPWPEELNRKITSLTASLHCAPTERAAQNLRREGIDDWRISVTGNTVIDALLWTVNRERSRAGCWESKYSRLANRRVVLITGHRRENFGEGFQGICRAIGELATQFPDIVFVYPVHLNPNVRDPVYRLLGGRDNILLIAPIPYPEFVRLMDRCELIVSDSGGVQEEAPSLKKPVLVMRDTTERPEALEAGAVELVGTSAETIIRRVTQLLTDQEDYRRHQIDKNPYGDGQAGKRIVELMLRHRW
jgi:UDP-N-acetylglucosamine 2-epimerase (non-hydrolysing)